jgi:hypothetical protein
MQDRDQWEERSSLIDFLADQLNGSRLGIVLGAGASMGFGLPSWDKLLHSAFVAAGKTPPSTTDNELLADSLLAQLGGDDLLLAGTVRTALYKEFDPSFPTMTTNRLLAAIGALTMASARGHVARVFSFNYDDVLEKYLRNFGFDVARVHALPQWSSDADVTVYHVHGLLPCDPREPTSSGIVLARCHFDKVVGKDSNLWRQLMLQNLSSATCLFIGLSGSDQNLTSVLTDVNPIHVSKNENHLFWGVRFSDQENDPLKSSWEMRGVYQHTLAYPDLPSFLLEVCQKAASKRRSGSTRDTRGMAPK